MSKRKNIFADGIANIRLQNGMVRIDLMTIEGGEKEGDPVSPELIERIIMPPEGFLRSYDTITRLINLLKDKGMIQKNNGQEISNV